MVKVEHLIKHLTCVTGGEQLRILLINVLIKTCRNQLEGSNLNRLRNIFGKFQGNRKRSDVSMVASFKLGYEGF